MKLDHELHEFNEIDKLNALLSYEQMERETLVRAFDPLATPLVADGCLRLGIEPRVAFPGIASVGRPHRLAGRVLPVLHRGSVDAFLEAVSRGAPGDVLVIDNQGRKDEGCIGDLTVMEVKYAGLSGIVVWGSHRDSEELVRIGFPVFSYGAYPAGPRRNDPQESASGHVKFCDFSVSAEDFVFADADGVIFVPAARASDIIVAAREIHRIEREQSEWIAKGRSLRQQLAFDQYLARRGSDPSYTFRRHLRLIGGAIEE